ncbi:hypothetical protein [Streptomyces scabichelini]|uniref:hypothetical protein n=1 Tax=Streptomyces scabichelini TaxID=2711217 RepID=UPI0019D20FBA|nr:hypothetical protein [Streptomyces scabichelini]
MSAELISPESIPQFTGDLEQLGLDALTLGAEAMVFRGSGAAVHSTFQGLSAFYDAPEAEQLFATTAPVAAKSDAFADDLEQVGKALSAYADEVRPLAARLKSLKARATTFRGDIAGDDDWREDDDNVQLNNDLVHDVNATVEAFWQAEITCHNTITALVGGTRLIMENGASKRLLPKGTSIYGFTADLMNQSQDLPWGQTVEKERHGLDWLGHQIVSFGEGFFVDGLWTMAQGLWTLGGGDGLDAMGKAWDGLGKLGVGLAVTLTPAAGVYWMLPDDKLPPLLRDSRTALKDTGKALVAYDQWGTNPARASGAVTFNVLTTVFTGGAGAAAKGGAISKTVAALGKAGRLVDPITYIGAAAKFGTVKVAGLFDSLKSVRTGAYTDAVSGAGRVQPDGSVLRTADDVPVVVGNQVVWPGGARLNLDDGSVVRADGTTAAARVELSAADRSMLEQSLPHRDPVMVHAGDNATAHVGDNASPQSSHQPSGGETASGHSRDLPDGAGAAHSHTSAPGGGGGDAGGPPVGGGSHLPDGPMEPRGNLPDGSWEGPQGLRLSPEENAATGQFMDRAVATEPRITEAIQAAAGRVEHGKLNGLEYRLKGEDSLKRKVATALLEDARLTPDRALANTRDSLRYTVEIPTRDYSHGVQQAVNELRARGFENVTFKNTWGGSGYKGINSTWRDPSTGQIFEVQFHTAESFVAKMDTHVLYEKGRLPGISSDEFAAIQAAQNDLFDRVPVPRGADSVRLDENLPGARAPEAPDVALGRHGDESVHGNGPPPELTAEQRTFHDAHLNDLARQYSDDFDQLKQDPDHKGKVKPSEMDEARVTLDLRENGKVPTDIQRPPGANQGDLYSPSTGEFYDIKGVHSDWPPLNNVRDKSLPFKGAYNPANNQGWVRKLEDQIVTKGRIVILDMRNANQAAINDVRSIVEQHGWSDRVVWYP